MSVLNKNRKLTGDNTGMKKLTLFMVVAMSLCVGAGQATDAVINLEAQNSKIAGMQMDTNANWQTEETTSLQDFSANPATFMFAQAETTDAESSSGFMDNIGKYLGIIIAIWLGSLPILLALLSVAKKVTAMTETKVDDQWVARIEGIVKKVDVWDEKVINFLEKTLNKDLDKDGDIGKAGSSSKE